MGHDANTFQDELDGYRKAGLNVIADDESSVEGEFFNVTDEDMARLDRYEGVAGGLYRSIKVTLKSGTEALVYEKCNPEQVVFGIGGIG